MNKLKHKNKFNYLSINEMEIIQEALWNYQGELLNKSIDIDFLFPLNSYEKRYNQIVDILKELDKKIDIKKEIV